MTYLQKPSEGQTDEHLLKSTPDLFPCMEGKNAKKSPGSKDVKYIQKIIE